MKVGWLVSAVIASLLISLLLIAILNIPQVFAAPSGAVEVEEDNTLQLGKSCKVVVTFRNTADTDITDVASTIQFITFAAANLNPSRTHIALDASWEIYVSEAATSPRAIGTVTGTLDTIGIYAPTPPLRPYTCILGPLGSLPVISLCIQMVGNFAMTLKS